MSSSDFIGEAVAAIENNTVPPGDRVFFAYWAWWEALGRPKDFFGEKIIIWCRQDNEWHTPEEIEEMGIRR